MRAIIDGEIYDTKASREVAIWTNGLAESDQMWASETLHQTEKGQYFLHGQGGASSKWARRAGRSSRRAKGIQALSDKEAMEWLWRSGRLETLEEEFGDHLQHR